MSDVDAASDDEDQVSNMPNMVSPDAVNYAVSQQAALRQRHYVQNSPTHAKRWVHFVPGKVADLQKLYGNDFCLVIAGDPAVPGDFYAIPWAEASVYFVDSNLYPERQKNGTTSLRWQIHLNGPPHEFQFELSRTELRTRPRFDAGRWYGNYVALGAPDQSVDDAILAELLAGGASCPEGQRLAAILHYRRERNRNLVDKAKARFLKRHGKLYCEVCDFEFLNKYGELGDGFIEAHHSVPLSSLAEGAVTRIQDLEMVCANCHRMLHRGDRWLTVDELRALVTTNQNSDMITGRV